MYFTNVLIDHFIHGQPKTAIFSASSLVLRDRIVFGILTMCGHPEKWEWCDRFICVIFLPEPGHVSHDACIVSSHMPTHSSLYLFYMQHMTPNFLRSWPYEMIRLRNDTSRLLEVFQLQF